MINYATLGLEYQEEMMGEENKHQFNHQTTQNIEKDGKYIMTTVVLFCKRALPIEQPL